MDHQNQRLLCEIQEALSILAARHKNDIIANAASVLAGRIESIGSPFGTRLSDLSNLDRQMMQYALERYRDSNKVA
jgi:hypothetical protein